MPKITDLYVFIAVGEGDEDEGIIGFKPGTGRLPLLVTDMFRADKMMPVARHIAQAADMKVKLLHFSHRLVLEEIV